MNRRSFLKSLLVGAVGASVPVSIVPTPAQHEMLTTVWKEFVSRVIVFDYELSYEERRQISEYLASTFNIDYRPCPVDGALVDMQATREGMLTIFQNNSYNSIN